MSGTVGPYWELPPEKPWWSFLVDGKVLATIEECALATRERKRLQGLRGVEVIVATPEHLQRIGASTTIPKRITRKMQQMYAAQLYKIGGGRHETNLDTGTDVPGGPCGLVFFRVVFLCSRAKQPGRVAAWQ